ncbi:MAG: SMP-30/gluconolactonase/LRE family protein [Alphaproteobacteria bacterium]
MSDTLRMGFGKSSWIAHIALFSLLCGLPAQAARAEEPRTFNPSAYYPEGPLAGDGGVYYAEMGRDRVLFSNGTHTRTIWSAPGCGPTSVSRYGSGFVVLCHRAAALVVISLAGETRGIIDRDNEGRPFPTPNASISDGRGGVYFSSSGRFGPDTEQTGAVLYLDNRGIVHRVAEGIHYANGVALSADGARLYVSEHLARNVLAYAVAADGSLRQPQVYLSLDDLRADTADQGWEVGPDGLATDRAGNLYIAEYGAGRLLIVGPDRQLRKLIEVEGQYVTAPALSPDEKTIYVTAPSARNPDRPGRVTAITNPLSAGQ